MRIAIASSGLGHVARGIEAWATDLARSLTDRGLAVTLYKGGGSPESEYEHVIPCCQRSAAWTDWLVRGPFRRGWWRLGLGTGYGIEQTTFALGLLAHLRKGSIDILHVQDPQIATVVQRAERLGWVPTRVVLAHGTNEPLSFLRKVRYLQHLAPHHLEEARSAGVWKPTWTAIPNFINTDLFRPGRCEALRTELEIPREGLVVLTVAAIKRSHKRIDYLLNEFALLRDAQPDLPVWLVVAGGWERDTDELIAQGRLLLGDRFRPLVRFPRERMPDLYRAADAFVLTSLREMMPIAMLEATASGLPCLMHRFPVGEWIAGPGGERVDMAESGALASALGVLLNDQARCHDLGKLARQYCLDHFSQDRIVDQILEYYDLVLTRGNLHPAARGEMQAGVGPIGRDCRAR